MGRRHHNALIDSGASHFVVPDIALLDEASAHVFPDATTPLITAGSNVPVERAAVLFAKIHCDSSDPNTTVIIRARALYAPELQSETLMPVAGLADEVTFRAPRPNRPGVATACLKAATVDDREITMLSIADEGVFPVRLEPLTKQEAKRYRGLFPSAATDTAIYATIPKDTPHERATPRWEDDDRATAPRAVTREETKQPAATQPAPRRETALSSENNDLSTAGTESPHQVNAARDSTASPASRIAVTGHANKARASATAESHARETTAPSWTEAVKTWADESDDGLPPIPASWIEAGIPTKGPGAQPPLTPRPTAEVTAPPRRGKRDKAPAKRDAAPATPETDVSAEGPGAESPPNRDPDVFGESSAQGAARFAKRAAAPPTTLCGRVTECPVCQMDISSWTMPDVEDHVDKCLDRSMETPQQAQTTVPPPDDETNEPAADWMVVQSRRTQVAAKATASAPRDRRDKGKEPAHAPASAPRDKRDKGKEPARAPAPAMIMTRSRQAAADAATSDAAVHGSEPLSDDEATPAPGPLGDPAFVRNLHARLGHPSSRRLGIAIHQGSIRIPEVERHMMSRDGRRIPPPLSRIVTALRAYECPHCVGAGFKASPRAKRKLGKDLLPFQVAHADLIPVRAAGRSREALRNKEPLDPFVPHPGFAHLLLVVDEATRYTLVAPCEDKSADAVANAFLNIDESIRWLMRTAREYDRAFAELKGYTAERIDDKSRSVIPHLHSDNGTEFLFGILAPGTPNGYGVAGRGEQPHVETVTGGFARHGAPRGTTSDTYRPHENGLAERRHQTLKARAKALMDEAGVGWKGYGHAYRCAAASENLVSTTIPVTGTRTVRQATPFAEVLGFPYDIVRRPLAPFGAIAITKEPKHKRRQFGTKKDVGVYLGPAVYPDRHLRVSAVNDHGYLSVALRTPETKVLTRGFLSSTIAERARDLADKMGSPRDLRVPPERTGDTFPLGRVTEDATTGENDSGDDERAPLAQIASSGSDTDESEPDSEPDPDSQRRATVREALREASRRRQTNDATRSPEITTPDTAPRVIMTRSRRAAADAAAATTQTDAGTNRPARALTARRARPSVTRRQRVAAGTAAAARAEARADRPVRALTARLARPSDGPLSAAAASHSPARARTARAHAIRPATDGTERRTIDQCSAEEIKAARQIEYKNLLDNGVFEPATLPRRRERVPLLDTKEVLKVRNDNSVKCRLTARGFLQRENIDYYGTYSPVTTPASIRIVVCLAAVFGSPLKTADCASAYLQAECLEEIYIALPRDLQLDGMDLRGADCFRLRKGLYGTKQAGRGWFYMLSKALIACGLKQAPEDPCLYFQHDASGKVTIALCTVVDDLLGAASDEDWADLMNNLQNHNVKLDLQSIGNAVEFNGMRIRRTGKHVYELDQGNYVDEVARAYSTAHGDDWRAKKTLSTPLGPSHDRALMKEMGDDDKGKRELEADRHLEADPKARKAMNTRYAGLLGSLLWAAVSTRPDVAFAASAAGQVASHPMSRHLKVIEHVLSYLVQTKDKGLVFDHSNHVGKLDLAALSDADFASDEASRRSRTGVWLGINGSPIYWVSKRQRMISDSTTAAETIAAFTALRQIRAIAGNLNAMGFRQRFTPLLIDNAVTLMRIVDNKKTDLGGAKHLSVLTKALQEAATPTEYFSDVWPVYVSTYENVADIFTKGYLSGQEAAERWVTLEQRARGVRPREPPPYGDWLEALLHTKRQSAGAGNRLTEAIELNQPMTSLKEYYRLSGRGTTYGGHLGAPSDLGGATPPPRAAPPTSRPPRAAPPTTPPPRGLRAVSGGEERARRPARGLKALEIFCGPNKSMEVALRELTTLPDLKGTWTLTTDTLDADESCRPSIWADVQRWKPEARFRPGEIDFVWASVPCPEYSRAKTTAPRDLETADAIGRAAVRLILWLRPKAFVLENPLGMFRDREYTRPLRRFLKETSYCKYGFRYYKPTDIITNINCHLPHCRTDPCEHRRRHGRHPETAQRGSSRNGTPGNPLDRLHRVPKALIQRLFLSAFFPEKIALENFLPGDVSGGESNRLTRAVSERRGGTHQRPPQGELRRSGGVREYKVMGVPADSPLV